MDSIGLVSFIYFLIFLEQGRGAPSEDLELRLVQIVSRHGFRAPEFPYPTDPYKDEAKYWPNGWGQLTELGKLHEYSLGKFVRRRYADLISPVYSTKEIFAISSDYDRTILSAQLVLAGLYESDTSAFGAFVPVRSIPKAMDRMIQPFQNCPRRAKLFTEVRETNEDYLNYMSKNKPLFDELRRNMGFNESTHINQVYNSVGTLCIQQMSNLSLPAWANELLASEEKMNVMSDGFKFPTQTETLKRLTAGPILGEIAKNMEKVINGKERRKLFLYAGHDITITNILNTVVVKSFHHSWPVFSSSLFFELYFKKSTQEYIIQLSYKNSTTGEDVYDLDLSACATPCVSAKFFPGFENYFPSRDDLDKECQLETSSLSTLNAGLIGGIVILGLLLIVLLIFGFYKSANNAYAVTASA